MPATESAASPTKAPLAMSMTCPLCRLTVAASWLKKHTDTRPAEEPAMRVLMRRRDAKGRIWWERYSGSHEALRATVDGYRRKFTMLMLEWLSAHGTDDHGAPIAVRVVGSDEHRVAMLMGLGVSPLALPAMPMRLTRSTLTMEDA